MLRLYYEVNGNKPDKIILAKTEGCPLTAHMSVMQSDGLGLATLRRLLYLPVSY